MIEKNVQVIVEERTDGSFLIHLPHDLVTGYGNSKESAVKNFYKWYNLVVESYGGDILLEELDNVKRVCVEELAIPIEFKDQEFVR